MESPRKPSPSESMGDLQAVRDQTRQMLELAEKSEWDELASLAQPRDELFNRVFSDIDLKDTSLQFQDMTRELLQLNQQLESLCSQQRKEIRSQLQSLSSGIKGVRLYQQNR